MSNRQAWTLRRAIGTALCGVGPVVAPIIVLAQSNVDGYVYGTAAAGTQVRIESANTGQARTTTVPSNGAFRSPNVPPGSYRVTFTNPAGMTETREVVVSIGAGTSVSVETVLVTGRRDRPVQVDMTSTESVTMLSAEQLEQIPVARDVQQVALLAPGVTLGDGGFKSQSGKALVSFGGASPGENTYFINGFNVTDFRNFLGGATIPFEFYDQFEVRTGGYSAEFGRSLGGVINAVTKRGTNNFEYGVTAYWQPDALTRDAPNSYYYDPDSGSTQIRYDQSKDYYSESQLNIQGGGPIIADKLFFYGLTVLREKRDDDAVGTTSFSKTSDDSPFFGGRLDWQIADNHALEYTFLRDRSVTDVEGYPYSSATGQVGELLNRAERKEGGNTHIVRYTGALLDDLSLSLLYGNGKRTQSSDNRSAVTGAACAVVYDARGGQLNPMGCWDTSNTELTALESEDIRESYRADFTWLLGSHTVKFGYDLEENVSDVAYTYEGGRYYRYVDATPGSTFNGGTVPAGVTEVVRDRVVSVEGDFTEKLQAFYIEDEWQITDRLLLSLGLRNETLESFNKNDVEFLDFGSQLTPRLGFTLDALGDGRFKIFGNAGRYTMPIATNTNMRFAGGEIFTEQYYTFSGINADGTPILGSPIGSTRFLSDGTVPVPEESVDRDLKPMYQDEFILGFQARVTASTALGLKVTYRDLVRAVEDSSFVDENNTFHYFLFNPGRDVVLRNADGSYVTITAEELGYDEATRKYWAAELSFDQQVSARVRLGGSYTWSHSYGNFEGVFQSDVQQDDAGITITFDTPGLGLYTYGDLPNDRRHNFKLYGSFLVSPEWTLSMSASATSGRPRNARGNCPVDIDPNAYEQDCFFAFGVPSPRASAGRLPWIYNLDLGVRYTPAFYDKLTLGLDVFNVFNFQKETRIVETVQQGGDETAPAEPAYGTAVYYQTPLYARVSASWMFR